MIDSTRVTKEKPYDFPTIDFKFQNAARVTAILWQFTVEVLEAEIDPSPHLQFGYSVDDGRVAFRDMRDTASSLQGDQSLAISVTNDGWGSAIDYEAALKHPTLNRLFSKDCLSFKGEIASEATKQIIRLQKPDGSQFDQIRNELMQAARGETEFQLKRVKGRQQHVPSDESGEWYKQMQERTRRKFESKWFMQVGREPAVPSIPIDDLKITWRCKDIKNGEHGGESPIYKSGPGQLYLVRDGFIFREFHVSDCAMRSPVTYCTIIDPSVGPHERIYPISRKIPPGDVERFHILIGASKSCRLKLRFVFAINKDQKVRSDNFVLQIWSPRRAHRNYVDGQEIARRATELRLKPNLQTREQWELERIGMEMALRGGNGADDPFHDPQPEQNRRKETTKVPSSRVDRAITGLAALGRSGALMEILRRWLERRQDKRQE